MMPKTAKKFSEFDRVVPEAGRAGFAKNKSVIKVAAYQEIFSEI